MMMKYAAYVLVPVVLLLSGVACSPPDPKNYVQESDPVSFPELPELVDEAVAPPAAGTGAPLRQEPPAVTPAPIAPTVSRAEPGDWNARGNELMEAFVAEFKAPDLAEISEITLSSGTVIRGNAIALTEDKITMAVAQGEVTYQNTNLAPASRVRLFAKDYAFMKAKTQVDRERVEFQKAQEQVRVNTEMASGTSVPRNAADGSVWQVMEYLKKNLRNPEHFRALQWGRVQRDRNGYVVTLKYQTTAGSLGVVTEHKYFFMDPTGKVVKTAALKGGD